MSREQLTGEEFAAKYLEGRRDFSGIELPDVTDLTSDIKKFFDVYDTTKPLILRGSKAIELVAPQICFYKADLREVDFKGADFNEADFAYADCRGANFSGADLSGAYFWRAKLEGTNFSKSNLIWTLFGGADSEEAIFFEAYFLWDRFHSTQQ